MKRSHFLGALALLLVAAIAFVALRGSSIDEASVGPSSTGSKSDSSAEQDLISPAGIRSASTKPTSPIDEGQAASLESVQSTSTRTVSDAPIGKEKADLDAKSPLALLILGEAEEPVLDALVEITGMRSQTRRGAWFAYRSGALSSRTDSGGRANFDVWDWVDIDGRTTAVSIRVSHPSYVPFRDGSLKIRSGDKVIHLQRGQQVSVRAWQGAPDRLVRDIEIELEKNANFGMDGWMDGPGGRRVTRRIAPGPHLLRVTHRPDTGPTLYSPMVPFEVSGEGPVDLLIELQAASVLRGTLGPTVPRPVLDGHVLLCIRTSTRGSDSESLFHTYECEIQSDGSFHFEDLPPGRGFLFALARGWVSKSTLAERAEDAGIYFDGTVTPEREAEALSSRDAFVLQRTDVPCGPIVLEMEPTAVVEIRVLDERGSPLPGSKAYVSPNFHVAGVGSNIVPWRTWYATTDGEGVARFDDVPPDAELWFGASSDNYQMRERDRARPPAVKAISGQTSSATLRLELDDQR